LHNVTKLPCHRYTPSFRHNMGHFSGNDALKWVDTCLGGQLSEPKQMSSDRA
jgi:hypothetical protein